MIDSSPEYFPLITRAYDDLPISERGDYQHNKLVEDTYQQQTATLWDF